MNKWIWLLFSMLVMICPGRSLAGESQVLKAQFAWIRDAPPMARMRSGYVDLRNNGSEAVAIVSASSTDFKQVEMHETRFENDLAKMVELPRVRIEPGAEFRFKPGAAHFMLMGPNRALSLGDKTEIILKLQSGETVVVPFVVSAQPKRNP